MVVTDQEITSCVFLSTVRVMSDTEAFHTQRGFAASPGTCDTLWSPEDTGSGLFSSIDSGQKARPQTIQPA